jgi:hypothetical protein
MPGTLSVKKAGAYEPAATAGAKIKVAGAYVDAAGLKMKVNGVYEAGVQPPVNTTPPSITGVPSSSNTLTCDPGDWDNEESIAFRWLRNGVPMIGETASTLLVYSTYIGDMIGCAVTAANAAGSTTALAAAVEIIP